ncbi:MAG: transposase [Desulfobacter sp.]|nr:transposase [Desulfobacter sp.]
MTDKIIHTVKEWQARPLENVYSIIWLDAIHYKVRENGKVGSKAVSHNSWGEYRGPQRGSWAVHPENEGANFWLQVLICLSNRGVKDILIACVDGLKAFPRPLRLYSRTQKFNPCVVHQISHH